MSKHTPEPWVLFEVGDRFKYQCPVSSDKTSILTVTSEDDMHFGAVYKDEDARRIVACVNAFAGIDIEQIECMPMDIKTLAQSFVQMTLQRDNLLLTLEKTSENLSDAASKMKWFSVSAAQKMLRIVDDVNAVIAKTKGGAA
ncbi:hypothetical protein [uncultured Tolumonas sp.]|uniref:hypothetical protein n=1 Tax=uncultured Tolumonas sp. TaxID=263765 RepID=UPI00292F74A4|nr:hypothetical protein [uncultured Tolumonas sp.]